MMKKRGLIFLIAILAAVVFAMPAWAGQLDAPSGVYFASDVCDNPSVDINEVVYTPEDVANAGDTVLVTLYGAKFDSSKPLYFVEVTGSTGAYTFVPSTADPSKVNVVGQYVGYSNADTSVTMRAILDSGSGQAWNPNMKMMLMDEIPTAAPGTSAAGYGFTADATSHTTNACISIKVDNLPPLPDTVDAAWKQIGCFRNKYAVAMDSGQSGACACINIDEQRTEFVATCTAADCDCTNVTSVTSSTCATFTLTGNTSITGGNIDEVKVVIRPSDGDMSAVSSITVDGLTATKYSDYAVYTFPSMAVLPHQFNVVINVNGSSVIAPRTWDAEITLIYDDGCEYSLDIVNDIMTWKICDGYQFKTYQTIEGEDPTASIYSFVYVVDEGDTGTPAQVWADILFSNGTRWNNVALPAVNEPGAQTYYGFDIIKAAIDQGIGSAVPTGINTKYEVTLTVAAPNNQVHGWAFEVRDGNQRSLAVFTNSDHTWKQ